MNQYLMPTDELSPFPPEGVILQFDPKWDGVQEKQPLPPLPELILLGSSIRGPEVFHGQTTNGNWVIFLWGEPICLILYTGTQFLRLKPLQHFAMRQKVEVRAQTIRSTLGWPQTDFVECDEYHWAGALKWAVGMNPRPPQRSPNE